MVMKIAHIAELKNRLSEYMRLVEGGEEVEIRKHNVPIARVVPLRRKVSTAERLGAGAGTVKIRGSLTESMIPPRAWNSLGKGR